MNGPLHQDIIIIITQGLLNTSTSQQKVNYINIYNQRTLIRKKKTNIAHKNVNWIINNKYTNTSDIDSTAIWNQILLKCIIT